MTEMKMIDTYWSDHCRHTTFLTKLEKVEINWDLANKIYEDYKKSREYVYDGKNRAVFRNKRDIPEKPFQLLHTVRGVVVFFAAFHDSFPGHFLGEVWSDPQQRGLLPLWQQKKHILALELVSQAVDGIRPENTKGIREGQPIILFPTNQCTQSKVDLMVIAFIWI